MLSEIQPDDRGLPNLKKVFLKFLNKSIKIEPDQVERVQLQPLVQRLPGLQVTKVGDEVQMFRI